MSFISDHDIPKHRKKTKSSVSKSREKSNHKHEYRSCMFFCEGRPYLGAYCVHCGKINDIRWGEAEKLPNGQYRLLSDKEFIARHSDLEKKSLVSEYQKYIPV